MIQFQNVSKHFSTPSGEAVTIFKDLNLTINQGEFLSLMGPSGTGKSTSLNLIAGLERVSQGAINIDSTDTTTLTDDQMTRFRGKHIGFIFQQFHLLPQLNVQDNIDLVVELNNLPRRFDTAEILEKVGLAGREKDYPSTLSGGEQQRVAVARAFVAQTPLLLADEPTGNLDQQTATVIMELMKSLHEEVHNTIIMITHDQDIASYATRQMKLRDYTIIQK